MMHLEGGITAERSGMVICRTSELHSQGLSGAIGACKSFAPEGAISTGRGLRPPSPPPGSAPDPKCLIKSGLTGNRSWKLPLQIRIRSPKKVTQSKYNPVMETGLISECYIIYRHAIFLPYWRRGVDHCQDNTGPGQADKGPSQANIQPPQATTEPS